MHSFVLMKVKYIGILLWDYGLCVMSNLIRGPWEGGGGREESNENYQVSISPVILQ